VTAAARSRSARRARWVATGLTAPSWLLLLALFAIPIGIGIWLSFRNEALNSFAEPRFVGLDNYQRMVTEPTSGELIDAAVVTVIIMGLGLAVQLPIGVGLAVLLNRQLKFSRWYRSALLIPMLLTPVAVGLMWRFMLDTDTGVINWLLERVGLFGPDWLGSRWGARVAVVLVDSWQSIPFVMLLILAGLAGIPDGPDEAARVDGASSLQVFRRITLPQLKPVLYVVLMIRVIDTFKLFDTIFILTRGGPGTATQTLAMYNYSLGFVLLKTSQAAALGTVLAIITLPVYFLWQRASRAVEA